MIISEVISRISALYEKGASSDNSRLSNRHIYNVLVSTRAALLRQAFDQNKGASDWIYQSIDCVEMRPADSKICACVDIPAGCSLLQSTTEIPKTIAPSLGSEISYVGNADGSKIYSSSDFVRNRYKSGNKYTSKRPDWFILERYLYVTIEDLLKYVSITAIFEDPLEVYEVDTCNEYTCLDPLSQVFPISASMIDPLINLTVNELIKIMKSVPEDKENDAQESASPGRSSVQSQTQK
tara:strand:+ start:589 stop:1302 length:714 start_codon:yes stop_codon:yes gene_type:complete